MRVRNKWVVNRRIIILIGGLIYSDQSGDKGVVLFQSVFIIIIESNYL